MKIFYISCYRSSDLFQTAKIGVNPKDGEYEQDDIFFLFISVEFEQQVRNNIFANLKVEVIGALWRPLSSLIRSPRQVHYSRLGNFPELPPAFANTASRLCREKNARTNTLKSISTSFSHASAQV